MRTRAALAAFALAAVPAVVAAGSCSVDSGTSAIDGQGGEFDPGVGGSGGDQGCATFEEAATLKPVNLYVMFDKSSSMASKWEATKTGLAAFVDDSASAGLRLGLRFFPRPPDAVAECDQNAYKEPAVDFGALPGHAQAIKDGMDAESPDGFGTPIYPALGGAILEGIDLAMDNPEYQSAVLLVTDGLPDGPDGTCSGVDPEDPAAIADLAATGRDFGVTTYVVGLPGVNQAVMDEIAVGGGSDQAIIVGNGDVAEEFRIALAKVRGQAIPCVYELPEQVKSGEVSLGFVNIEVTPGDGSEPFTVPYDQSCNGGGWRYDVEDAPTAIELCPETCAAIHEDLDALLRVVLGCNTFVE
jgi:hypothetical protein